MFYCQANSLLRYSNVSVLKYVACNSITTDIATDINIYVFLITIACKKAIMFFFKL